MTHRLALLTGAGTLALIVFGGLVTNSGSAMAVPDWPSTFGHNMFLFPWSHMVGGVFFEHSHRLIGAGVGLLTLVLAGSLWRAGGPRRWLGLAAVGAVVAQGVIGGLRVVLVDPRLALIHGPLAQAFFALIVVIALLTSTRMRARRAPVDPSVAGLAVAGAAAAVYVQIVSGALLTHAGWLAPHLVGAAAVYVIVPMVTARLRRSGDPVAAPLAWALLVLLGVQLVLGVGAFAVRLSPGGTFGGPIVRLGLPVTHRVVASLILGAAVALAVRVAPHLAVARTGRTAGWPGPAASRSASEAGG